MRILYIAADLDHGLTTLAARSTHALARMAQREGHHVRVLSFAPPSGTPALGADSAAGALPELIDGVPMHRQPAVGHESGHGALLAWLKAQRFDIAHAVDGVPDMEWLDALDEVRVPCWIGLLGLPAEAAPGRGSAATSASGPDPAAGRMLARAVLRSVPSRHAAAMWQSRHPELAFRVLGLGVDSLALLGTEQKRRGQFVSCQAATALCVGPLHAASGVLHLLRAWAARPAMPARLLLVGDAGGDATHAQAIAEAVAADGRVQWLPGTDPRSLVDVAQPFDLLCCPDSRPRAVAPWINECAALGLPCLASDLGAQAEAVRDLQCGTLLVPGAVADWADAIEAWAIGFDVLRPVRLGGPMPLRIEEQAFFSEGLYRELLFRARS